VTACPAIVVSKAVRMDGYFEVWTPRGLMTCRDGWLALDEHGDPYPVAAHVFARAYAPEGDVYIGAMP
jgi:hypothetical protein